MSWKVTDVTRHGASTVTFSAEETARNCYTARVANPETWFIVLLESEFVHDAYVSDALGIAKERG